MSLWHDQCHFLNSLYYPPQLPWSGQWETSCVCGGRGVVFIPTRHERSASDTVMNSQNFSVLLITKAPNSKSDLVTPRSLIYYDWHTRYYHSIVASSLYQVCAFGCSLVTFRIVPSQSSLVTTMYELQLTSTAVILAAFTAFSRLL